MSSTEPPRRPPLAGKPPFATDDPDDLFDHPPPSKRRVRKPAEANPNDRTSAYNMYDQYLDHADASIRQSGFGAVGLNDTDASNRQSGFGAVGLGLLNGNFSEDEDEDALMHKPPMATEPKHGSTMNAHPIPLAAPRPGYPAPVAALKMPSPAATPEMRQVTQPVVNQPQPPPMPNALRVNHHLANTALPRMPAPIYETPSPRPVVPSTPHPLQPPMTPITPVFARPAKSPAPRDIQFKNDVIIRGGSEDNLMPKRGEKGDDFWRRFSIVARDEKKTSSWLIKTQSGTSRLSRWVWFLGIVFLICIGGGIGIGWYLSHKSPTNTEPKAVGGSANESMTTSHTVAVSSSTMTSLHVSPTNTVARRNVYEAVPSPVQGFLEEIDQASTRVARKHRRVSEIQF